MVLVVSVCPQAVFLVVIRVAGHSLVGMDLLNVLQGGGLHRRRMIAALLKAVRHASRTNTNAREDLPELLVSAIIHGLIGGGARNQCVD